MTTIKPMITECEPLQLGPKPNRIGRDKKYYLFALDGRRVYAKQSMLRSEIAPNLKHRTALSRQCAERIRNEAAAIEYVARNTRIPVPDIVAYHDAGAVVTLATAKVEGVPLFTLPERESRAEVSRQLDDMTRELRAITSDQAKSFSGLLCLHPTISGFRRFRLYPPLEAKQGETFPLCHGDLTASNVVVDPDSLRVKAILDWEYAGFYPELMDFAWHHLAIDTPRGFDPSAMPRGWVKRCLEQLDLLLEAPTAPLPAAGASISVKV